MNISSLFVLYTVITQLTKSTADFTKMKEALKKPPLALIQRNSEIFLANPKTRLNGYVYYYFDSSEEQFIIACPDVEDENVITPSGKTDDSNEEICEKSLRPTVVKTEKRGCFYDGEVRKGEEYQVGYWVENKETMISEHKTVYKICYSNQEGTLYTEHTIANWNNLIKQSKNNSLKLQDGLLSSIWGENLNEEIKKNENLKAYQLVYWYDLPVDSWRFATLFNFNMILVPGIEELNLLQQVDRDVRESTKYKESRPTVYAGSFTIAADKVELLKKKVGKNLKKKTEKSQNRNRPVINESASALDELKETNESIPASQFLWRTINVSNYKKEYTFIWKILHHETDGAIVIITLIHPFDECVVICPNVTAQANWLSRYKSPSKKECTYVCRVDGVINKMFGLSHLGEISRLLAW